MQELAEKVGINDVQDNPAATAELADEQTLKQINDIDDALKGKDKNSGNNGSGPKSLKERLLSREPAKRKSLKEIPANLSAETGAALKRFDSLLNGTAKLDGGAFKGRPKNGVAKPVEDAAPTARRKHADLMAKAPQENITNDAAPETDVDALSAKAVSEGLAADLSNAVAAQAPKVNGLEEARTAEVTAPPVDGGGTVEEQAVDTKLDFFAVRRTLRQLQFNYSINKPHDDKIRDDFEDVLGAFSQMSVQYQMMSEDHAKRMDERNQLVRARCEVREVHSELQKAQQLAKNAEARRTKDLEAFTELTARQNASRTELRKANEAVETLKREIQEQAQDFESKQQEGMKLIEEASLAEAEKVVLRESLSEACDRIAELMSIELRNENAIQALEDEVAELRARQNMDH